jgi:S1-C subfamily serine protease
MKKKKTVLFTILFILLPITAYGVNYTLTSATYSINVNGQKLAVQPLNLNGTTYLPIRSISEAVGVPIEWTGKSVEITTLDLDRLKEASVMIYADDGKTQVQGSGVYTDYGEVTSAFHLIADNRTNLKTSEGDKLTVDDTDQPLDIMTLDSIDDTKPVKIGDSDDVKVGDKVIIISAPNGKNDTVTYGTVKDLKPLGADEILINAKLSDGSSGGAVVNMSGELIGIIVAGLGADHFAIPINHIRETF